MRVNIITLYILYRTTIFKKVQVVSKNNHLPKVINVLKLFENEIFNLILNLLCQKLKFKMTFNFGFDHSMTLKYKIAIILHSTSSNYSKLVCVIQ